MLCFDFVPARPEVRMDPFPYPRLSRRSFLAGLAATTAALVLPRGGARADQAFVLPDATRAALGESPLIYVSPLRSDGSESACHGEVWFVRDGAELLVVTASDRWKARAVRGGLDRARIWVGDFGQWKKADGRFKAGPTFVAKARFDSDPAAIEAALGAFGAKYSEEWGKWEPRFRKGLADRSRVLVRYRPVGG
jgi:hypothetical protein